MRTKFILRCDDITPGMAWSKFLPFKNFTEKYGISIILGVVPDNKDLGLTVEKERSDFFDYIRQWKYYGDVITQHGTHHLYDSKDPGILGINDNSEFAGHNFETQLNKLSLGQKILGHEGVFEPYFMAPSHSYDINTLKALKQLGFEALTDGYGFFPYKDHGITCVPSLTSFPMNVGFGVCTICLHINMMNKNQIDHIQSFISKNHKKFINFKDAINMDDVAIMGPALRYGTSSILQTKRRLRKFLKK